MRNCLQEGIHNKGIYAVRHTVRELLIMITDGKKFHPLERDRYENGSEPKKEYQLNLMELKT